MKCEICDTEILPRRHRSQPRTYTPKRFCSQNCRCAGMRDARRYHERRKNRCPECHQPATEFCPGPHPGYSYERAVRRGDVEDRVFSERMAELDRLSEIERAERARRTA